MDRGRTQNDLSVPIRPTLGYESALPAAWEGGSSTRFELCHADERARRIGRRRGSAGSGPLSSSGASTMARHRAQPRMRTMTE